jgi:hypothetical protein
MRSTNSAVESFILVIRNGQPVFIEVKSEKGKPSQDQLDFGRDAILAGGMYVIARSIDDVQKNRPLMA